MSTPSRHSRYDAPLVKACAAEHGVSERAIRAWRRNADPRWSAFLHSRARDSALPGIPTAGIEEAANKLLNPAEEEQAAARRLAAVQALIDGALASKDSVTLPGLLRAGVEASKMLREARNSRQAWDLSSGRLVPRSEVEELRRRFIEPLGNVIRNMPAEVGPKANSFDPAFGIRVCEEWLRHRFTPALERAKEAFGADDENSHNETKTTDNE